MTVTGWRRTLNVVVLVTMLAAGTSLVSRLGRTSAPLLIQREG